MAVTVPSAANIKMKFAPAFDNTADATIEFAIEEAALIVGDGWRIQQTLAMMYFTAHLLAIASSAASTDGREVTSETFGRISVTYKSSNGGTLTELETTIYGTRFAEIRKANFPGFAII